MSEKPKKSKIKKSSIVEDKIINFYELDNVKQYAYNYINPNYNFEKMPLKHPMRMVICGASGSGKSNILLNIINKMNNTFEKILFFTQDKDEQLYNFLENTLDSDSFEIFEGIKSVNDYNFDNLEEKQYLIIFDDMCIESEKKQQPICELFIRGRKMAHKCGCSLIYLTQSYFQVPPIIRKQMTYLILRKINGKRDSVNILRDCAINASSKQLINMYEICCNPNDIKTFLFIDLSASENNRFRFQFDTMLDINDF